MAVCAVRKGKKIVKAKKIAAPMPSMGDSWKPKPVSIHLHAEGAHLKEAHANLAQQLKPLGFTQKKKGTMPRGSRKSIAEALSS